MSMAELRKDMLMELMTKIQLYRHDLDTYIPKKYKLIGIRIHPKTDADLKAHVFAHSIFETNLDNLCGLKVWVDHHCEEGKIEGLVELQ